MKLIALGVVLLMGPIYPGQKIKNRKNGLNQGLFPVDIWQLTTGDLEDGICDIALKSGFLCINHKKPLRGVGFVVTGSFSVLSPWSTLLSRGGQLMSTKENVTLMRRWFEEVWNQGKDRDH
jgi:hypothetical protein